MKRHLAMICLILAFTDSHGQKVSSPARHTCMTGVEMASAIRSGIMSFCINCSLTDKWSIYAEGGTDLNVLLKKEITESYIHMSEFGNNDEKGYMTEDTEKFHIDLYMQYWPGISHKGLHFNIGMHLAPDRNTDGIVGIGYLFGIWKGLNASVGYDIGIISAARQKSLSDKGIRAHLYYKF